MRLEVYDGFSGNYLIMKLNIAFIAKISKAVSERIISPSAVFPILSY